MRPNRLSEQDRATNTEQSRDSDATNRVRSAEQGGQPSIFFTQSIRVARVTQPSAHRIE